MTEVLAVTVRVVLNAPLVVKLPPSVIVLLSLLTPVPPFTPPNIPLTSSVNLTAPQVGRPDALPCNTCVVVPVELNVAGATPAPPPITIALAVNAAELAHVVPLEK